MAEDDSQVLPQGSETVLGDRRRIEDGINDAKRGLISTIGNVTLNTGATTTTVTHYGCSTTSAVILVPTNQNAAREMYGYWLDRESTYVTPAKGSFTINHPNNAETRTYRYVFFSGIRL